MTNKWVEGFEVDSTYAGLKQKYVFVPWSGHAYSNAVFSTGAGSFGGNSLRLSSGTAGDPPTSFRATWMQSGAGGLFDSLFVGLRVRAWAPVTTPTNAMALLTVLDSAGLPKMFLRMVPGGATSTYKFQLEVGTDFTTTANNTVIFTSAADIPFGEWVYIELNAVMRNAGTGGHSWDFRIGGTSVGTGVDVTSPSTDGWGGLNFCLAPDHTDPSGYVEIDDIYVNDAESIAAATTKNSGYLGDQHVEGLRPTGVGKQTDWVLVKGPTGVGTNNYEMVDDVDVDNDDTYVKTEGINQYDTYAYGDLQRINGSINSVAYIVHARPQSSATKTMDLVTDNDAGTRLTSSLSITLNNQTGYGTFIEFMNDDPFDAKAWDVLRVDTKQFGYRST